MNYTLNISNNNSKTGEAISVLGSVKMPDGKSPVADVTVVYQDSQKGHGLGLSGTVSDEDSAIKADVTLINSGDKYSLSGRIGENGVNFSGEYTSQTAVPLGAEKPGASAGVSINFPKHGDPQLALKIDGVTGVPLSVNKGDSASNNKGYDSSNSVLDGFKSLLEESSKLQKLLEGKFDFSGGTDSGNNVASPDSGGNSSSAGSSSGSNNPGSLGSGIDGSSLSSSLLDFANTGLGAGSGNIPSNPDFLGSGIDGSSFGTGVFDNDYSSSFGENIGFSSVGGQASSSTHAPVGQMEASGLSWYGQENYNDSLPQGDFYLPQDIPMTFDPFYDAFPSSGYGGSYFA